MRCAGLAIHKIRAVLCHLKHVINLTVKGGIKRSTHSGYPDILFNTCRDPEPLFAEHTHNQDVFRLCIYRYILSINLLLFIIRNLWLVTRKPQFEVR